MDTKKIILLVGALVVAAASAFGVRMMLAGSGAPPVQAVIAEPDQIESGVKVIVAQSTLPIGTIISEEHVTFQPWPEDMVQHAYYAQGREGEAAEGDTVPAKIEDVLGKVVRLSIAAGQPVAKNAVIGPGENGFLAAALNPGMRAVTVPIDNIRGVAGFIFPGDRVDILLTHTVGTAQKEGNYTAAGELKVAETVARNVRVLAIDQRLSEMQTSAQAGQTVTFEVPPKMVEKIQVAKMLGALHLSLRSIKEQKLAFEQAIANGDVILGENDEDADLQAAEFATRQLPDDRGSTYTSGGEVSQFAFGDYSMPRNMQKAAAYANGPDTVNVRIRRGGSASNVAVNPAGNVTVVTSGQVSGAGEATGAVIRDIQ